MYATDFTFNGRSSKEFGVMICSFDGDAATASGGEVEYNSVLPPNSDRYTFYGAQLPNVLEWTFSICKNTCENSRQEDSYFTLSEERHLAKWLLCEDGYKYLNFMSDEYADIYYQVYFKMTPHQINGHTVGFDLTATSNCAYGFSHEYSPGQIVLSNSAGNERTLCLQVNSDKKEKIFPFVTIQGTGDFSIINSDVNDNIICKSEFTNVADEIIMDSANDLIMGLASPNDFNWNFLYLINGLNIFRVESQIGTDVTITVTYREAIVSSNV